VVARASKLIPVRRDAEAEGKKVRVGTPDSVQVLTTHADRSIGIYRLTGLALHHGGTGVTLYGSRGTLVYDLGADVLRGSRRGSAVLEPLEIPAGLRGGWNVEADFVAAIREEKPVTRTDFESGARYMQFTEAVARSSRHEKPVDLPLSEFSNPGL
jgi:predicted dehydrogenase